MLTLKLTYPEWPWTMKYHSMCRRWPEFLVGTNRTSFFPFFRSEFVSYSDTKAFWHSLSPRRVWSHIQPTWFRWPQLSVKVQEHFRFILPHRHYNSLSVVFIFWYDDVRFRVRTKVEITPSSRNPSHLKWPWTRKYHPICPVDLNFRLASKK